jgi:hypothetical protein
LSLASGEVDSSTHLRDHLLAVPTPVIEEKHAELGKIDGTCVEAHRHLLA